MQGKSAGTTNISHPVIMFKSWSNVLVRQMFNELFRGGINWHSFNGVHKKNWSWLYTNIQQWSPFLLLGSFYPQKPRSMWIIFIIFPHFKLQALASLFNCSTFYQKIRQCFLRVAHALNSAVTATCAALGNWFLTNLYLKYKGKSLLKTLP